MNGVLTVYQKELRTYFRSPIAYFVMAIFLVGTGYFFTYSIFLTGNARMTETFQNMAILLLLVLPVVSMRLFTSEYNGRTMELLATLPLSPWLIDVVPLYLFGNPEGMTILSGYIGFILLGMACLAIGQLFSALTQNQIVAALITVAVLLAFWFIANAQRFQTSYAWRNLLGYLSFSRHFEEFVQGLVRTESVIFYLVVCAIVLVLNTSYLHWQR